MTKSPLKADAFLRAMAPEPEVPPTASVSVVAPIEPVSQVKPRAASRDGLKHIGGYFDRETVEKVAVLRARLDLDNSELLKLAVEELHRKHTAQRSFGDA